MISYMNVLEVVVVGTTLVVNEFLLFGLIAFIAALFLGLGKGNGIQTLLWDGPRWVNGLALGITFVFIWFYGLFLNIEHWLQYLGFGSGGKSSALTPGPKYSTVGAYLWHAVSCGVACVLLVGLVVFHRIWQQPSRGPTPKNPPFAWSVLVGFMFGAVVFVAGLSGALLLLTEEKQQNHGGPIRILGVVCSVMVLGLNLVFALSRRLQSLVPPVVLLGLGVSGFLSLYLFLTLIAKAVVAAFHALAPNVSANNLLVLAFLLFALVVTGLQRYRVRLAALGDFYAKCPPPTDSPQFLTPTAITDNKLPKKLILFAVSGGGITAAAWTLRTLLRLEEQIPELGKHTRLITGASGGMLGAAYYTATLSESGGHSKEQRDQLPSKLERDFLSPVLRRLLFRDLPRSMIPWPLVLTDNRGDELDRQWVEHMPELGGSFETLRNGERMGWRPALVFSPMLVGGDNAGKRLLLSNVDLGNLFSDGSTAPATARPFVQYFDEYRGAAAGAISLATAARLCATFPLVSPSPVLPRCGGRVVDAGYYDNYGVDLALAWIFANLNRIREQDVSVRVVEIRAFPTTEEPSSPRRLFQQVSRSLQTYTTPFEGLTTARTAVMNYRNQQESRLIGGLLNTNQNPDRFGHIRIICPEHFPLSWYLTDDEFKALAGHVNNPAANEVMKLTEWCKPGN